MENNPKTTQMQQGNPNAMFVFFGMVFLAQMDGNNPKPKQMQQGNPNAMFCLAWFSLPKWMKNNLKKRDLP